MLAVCDHALDGEEVVALDDTRRAGIAAQGRQYNNEVGPSI